MSEFKAVEIGVVEDVTETVESRTQSLESSNWNLATIFQETVGARKIEVQKREFSIARFQNDNDWIS